ncbi:MAG: GTPase Era [Bacteroidetes bacterium]|nr:MAG: GTPase Era [Bacteroidota bacterium]
MPDPNINNIHRSGYAALIGKPNVGKSTLINALLGQKISIVTRKPQTTRHRVLGILSEDDYQLILLDTPGIIKPKYGLQRAMMKSVAGAAQDADVLVFIADATRDKIDTHTMEILAGKPTILAVNKLDLVSQDQLLPLVQSYSDEVEFEEVIPISALKGTNLDKLIAEIVNRLPFGPPLYPKDVVSEHPERFFVAEIIREKIFQQFRQEIPYSCQVNVVSFEERKQDKTLIHADIVIERESQKGILIGKKGAALKRIGSVARIDIEDFLGEPIFLKLFVKVRSDWRNRDAFLKSYGYDLG